MELLLPVCTLLAVLQLTTSASIRGVPPSLHSVYDASSDAFKCLDGSKSLPWSRINDNYCDCVDGSDEPGKREHNFLVRQLAARTLTFDCRLHARLRGQTLFLQAHLPAVTAVSTAATEDTNL